MHAVHRAMVRRRNRRAILARIGEAAARAGRDPAAVEIVAVTKTVPVERIREAVAAGFRSFGENRVQERAAKAVELDAAASYPAGEAPRWHLVGPLQSNKARAAVELFDVIQTVDSLELAQRLDRLASEIRPGRPYPVLLQVNVDADAAKSGFEPADLERDLPEILDLPALSVDGPDDRRSTGRRRRGGAPDVRRAARPVRAAAGSRRPPGTRAVDGHER